jgi:hypothetical protein
MGAAFSQQRNPRAPNLARAIRALVPTSCLIAGEWRPSLFDSTRGPAHEVKEWRQIQLYTCPQRVRIDKTHIGHNRSDFGCIATKRARDRTC